MLVNKRSVRSEERRCCSTAFLLSGFFQPSVLLRPDQHIGDTTTIFVTGVAQWRGIGQNPSSGLTVHLDGHMGEFMDTCQTLTVF